VVQLPQDPLHDPNSSHSSGLGELVGEGLQLHSSFALKTQNESHPYDKDVSQHTGSNSQTKHSHSSQSQPAVSCTMLQFPHNPLAHVSELLQVSAKSVGGDVKEKGSADGATENVGATLSDG
jgi:hypothetical protein